MVDFITILTSHGLTRTNLDTSWGADHQLAGNKHTAGIARPTALAFSTCMMCTLSAAQHTILNKVQCTVVVGLKHGVHLRQSCART